MPPKSNYGFALGLAGQMLATIVLGVVVGSWIDSNDPPQMGRIWGSLAGTVVAVAIVVVQVLKNQDQ